MSSTTRFEIDELSLQAREVYYNVLDGLHDSYDPPPDDHHCFGARDHHARYDFEDADRFQAYTKALDLQFEEPDSQGATRGTVRTAPEVDTVQGHYGIYRIIDQVHNARIAQACHPGLRGMEFIEIDISDELYFGDILAVKTLAFNPGYFPRPSGSSVLPYHRTTATLPGDHCRWSAREYLVFRRDIRTSQMLLRVDDRVGVIEGFSGLTRLPSSFHAGRVYLGDVFYPEHLEIRGLTPILTHLPTILRHWKSRCAVPESLRALADSADLQNTRFDHRMFQHRVKICRGDELTVNCSADWLVGSRVLVGFLDREIEAVLVKGCNGNLTFQLLERYTGPPWVPVMVQQLGFQGEPLEDRGRSRRLSREDSEEYRGDRVDRGDRGRSRSPSEQRYPQPLVGVYDPEPDRGSPDFEERYGRDEGQRRGPEGDWDRQGQWDGPSGQDPRDSRQGYRPSSPEQRNWSPGPRQWNRNDPPRQWDQSSSDYQPRNTFSQPQESFSSQGAQFRQARESFGSQDAQFRRPESEQYQNDPQQPSEYRNQPQQGFDPQFSLQGGQGYRNDASRYSSDQSGRSNPHFSPQTAQFYRSQPGDRPNDSQYPFRQSGHPQDRSLHHNPLEGRYNDSPCSSDQRSLTLEQYNAQNYQNYQRERGQSYGNDPQYPSDQRSQSQKHFQPEFSLQNAQSPRNQAQDCSGNGSGYPAVQPGHPVSQYGNQNAQCYRNQSDDHRSYANDAQYRNQDQDRPDNASGYPSDRAGHLQERFESPSSSQNHPFHRTQPEDRSNASKYQSSPQYQSEYRGQHQNPSNPQFSPPNAQPYCSDYPIIQTEQPNLRQDFQADRDYRNQTDERFGSASRYPSDHPEYPHSDGRPANASHYSPDHQDYRGQSHDHFKPQFDRQNSQSYRSQPENHPFYANDSQYPPNQPGHPLEAPILTQNRPAFRNQPGDRQYDSPYPSEYRGQHQEHFKPPFSLQNDHNQAHGGPQYPLGQSGTSNPHYAPQHHRNQSEDRQTLPRSLSPRVSTLSPSGDPIIRHSQSRSSVSQASSVSGGHFQGEQQRFDAPSAPRASCSSGQAQSSHPPLNHGHPARNSLSYHSNQPQGPQPPANQGHDIPSTSRAAGYSDGLSPTGQSYYQGYATSSDGSEEDSSSESEPEIPQKVQKRGYNALYSHFPSSSGQKSREGYSPRVPDHQEDPQGHLSPSVPREPGQPGSSSIPEPKELLTPPKPVRVKTPPFDPHNSRSWRHGHKDDICEVVEPVSQGQGGSRASQQPSQPVRDYWDPVSSQRDSVGRSSADQRTLDPEPSQNKSGSRSTAHHRTSQASSYPSQPVVEFPEPSKPGSRSSVDYRTSQTSQRPSHPAKAHQDPQTSSQSSTDHRGPSQASHHPVQDSWPVEDNPYSKPSRSSLDRKASTASHYSADPKWPTEPENSAPEEDQHPEPLAREHPYLPALLKHQILVIDALDAELHIASAAASLAKTDWNLKARGLKQRGTQVIVCKATEAPRITGLLLDALHDASGAYGLKLMRFTDEQLLQIDFDRCLARKLRGILREPGAWDQRIVLQAARHLTNDPLGPKLENLLRNNSHIPEMSLEEWVAWYMERWVPDVLLSTPEYLEVGTKYLRRVESVQVLGEVSEEHGELTARFPKAKIAVIGDVLGEAGGNLNPETVEILKEAFSGLRGSQLISLRSEDPYLRPPGPDYLKIRPGIFPSPEFPILLIHNTSTKGTKEERNLQERKALDELVKGLLGLETDLPIPPEDLQVICIEKNQVRELRTISTPGIRIRSRQEGAEGVQGVLTQPEGSPGLREEDPAPQNLPQTTPIAIICCSNYKKSAFELIRAQLPQLLSYGTQAIIFIGNIDEMEEAEGWSALVTRCEEVGCSYSYQMVPEERSRRYQPTKRDHMGFMGPLPEYGSSRGSSSEFGGFESPKSRSSGSGSPRSMTSGSSVSPRSEPAEAEPSEVEPKESEPWETEQEACEPKPEELEPSRPKPEESEPSETEQVACEPEPEESEPSEPEIEDCEPKSGEPEQSELEPEACEPEHKESELTEPSHAEPQPLEPKHKVSEPKFEGPEQSKPELVASEPSEPKSEEPEPFEPKPEGPELFEPKPEENKPSESTPEPPRLKTEEHEPSGSKPGNHELNSEESEESEPTEPSELKPEPSGLETDESESSGPGTEARGSKSKEPETPEPVLELPEPKTPILPQDSPKSSISEPTSPNPTLEHLDLAMTATVSPTLSPAIPRKSCSLPPEKDFTTPDCLLETITLEDLEPSDQEYEDCEEEFQDAQEAENQDSDTETYESTYSDHQGTTGPEESESLEKFEEKQ